MRRGVAAVLAILMAGPALAQDLDAAERLKAELNHTKKVAGAGLALLGVAVGVYGALQWSDAQDANDEITTADAAELPTGRYAVLIAGGVISSVVGLDLLFFSRDVTDSPKSGEARGSSNRW